MPLHENTAPDILARLQAALGTEQGLAVFMDTWFVNGKPIGDCTRADLRAGAEQEHLASKMLCAGADAQDYRGRE